MLSLSKGYLLIPLLLCMAIPSWAQNNVELRLTGITTIDPDDPTFETVIVPDQTDKQVAIKVSFEVRGAQTRPMDIVVGMDGVIIRQHFKSFALGTHSAIYRFGIPLSLKPQVHLTLDPQGTSGDVDPSDNSFNAPLTITPARNMPAVMHVEQRDYILKERFSYLFPRSMAGRTIPLTIARVRETSTVQILETDAQDTPDDETDTVTYQARVGSDGRLTFNRQTKLRLSNMRVNPAKLEAISWEDLSKDPMTTQFTGMSPHLDGDSIEVQRFIRSCLGLDYKQKMSPFTAAKEIHRAIKNGLKYKVTDCYIPSQILRSGEGQCASAARLMCATLRSIGIPSRTVGGFFAGQTGQGHDGHRICEFYLPKVGWVPCDPTPPLRVTENNGALMMTGTLDDFANTIATNRLWATWCDDTLYDCGVQLPTIPMPLQTNCEFILQPVSPLK